MGYTDEQREMILSIYGTIENYEQIEARRYLNSTDYVVIKMYEYSLRGKEIDNDYTEILNKREECREIIRKYDEKQ